MLSVFPNQLFSGLILIFITDVKACILMLLFLCLMETGVPQGSSLGPFLFSIFINDLPQICLDCQIHLYADDTVIYTFKHDISKIQTSLQFDFNLIQTWFSSNLLLLNKNKSYSMLFATRSALNKQSNSLEVKFLDGTPLENVEEFKYLGL